MILAAWCCLPFAADAGFADARAFVKQHCVACHGAAKREADLDLEKFADEAAAVKGLEAWERALGQVKEGTMPPPKRPKPSPAEVEKFADAVAALAAQAPPPKTIDPGRVTMRRLNRAEYNNTMRDLLGVDLQPADAFPVDDTGYGFDNNGDVLALAPALLEKYFHAAETCVNAALERPPALVGPEVLRNFQGRELKETGEIDRTRVRGRLWKKMTSNGELFVEVELPRAGKYAMTVRAFQDAAGKEPAKLALLVDGQQLKVVEVDAAESRPKRFFAEATLKPGKHRFALGYLNDFHDAKAPAGAQDRNLAVVSMEVRGPIGAGPVEREPSAAYQAIMIARPNGTNDQEVAVRILRAFARRAYRRPPQNVEVERLAGVYAKARAAGDDFDEALKLALQAALVSPKFLYRAEFDQDAGVYALSGYEMASRLSYFLWSSMPDEELFRLAHENKLGEPEVLRQQALRMLADPKAAAFAENFAGQWLQTRSLASASPDPEVFPAWNEGLRKAFAKETELYFDAMLRDKRDLLEFIDGKFAFVNATLARHYGLPNVQGEEFRRVSLVGTPRAGLLTQGNFLTVTSNPTRTSPVKRGKWILENLLASPPPPPPPDVPELEKAALKGTLRQRLEQHRANAVCASCHQRMDPLGLAFEHFDGIGKYRERDAGSKIDASGVLPSGQKFADAAELRRILKGRKDQFRRCLAEKLLTYALGRGLERSDRFTVDKICQGTAAAGDHLQAMVLETVLSDPFRKRRAGEPQ